MKRKHDGDHALHDTKGVAGVVAKQVKRSKSHGHDFHGGLFDGANVTRYKSAYAESTPYNHAVVQPLIAEDLLRSVRREIIDNIHFTAKETDIYRIFQSGDLANLDGLQESALCKLPSLLQLRDALYSPQFRAWISDVSGAGPVSGQKTDMAINVYKPGCHLLCHDDVIGSRRVSYILYLTDPDQPWQPKWGGALRLYPTSLQKSDNGREVRVPDSLWSKSIPPAWNQLSFFAVQPGQSFHDVEEVYAQQEDTNADDSDRVRMAISGWFHIPQEGESGFEAGLEERLAEQSSLQQLQAKDTALDKPTGEIDDDATTSVDHDASELTQDELDFLIRYMNPQYLTPDTVEELSEIFTEESSLQLSEILAAKLAKRLRTQVNEAEHLTQHDDKWQVSCPPHKHRYLFRYHESKHASHDDDLLGSILNEFLPSAAFRKWLCLVTGLTLGSTNPIARRFRRGLDYTLATTHEDDNMLLEWCLNLTPSQGWTGNVQEVTEDESNAAIDNTKSNGHSQNGPSKGKDKHTTQDEDPSPGGYELYMAGDDIEADSDDEGSDHGVSIPTGAGQATSSSTGGGHRRVLRSKVVDPAVYNANADEEDDGILFSNPASWNTMSLVLRDKGTLRFVKYVSASAPGDRWDIVGSAIASSNDLDESDDDDDDDK